MTLAFRWSGWGDRTPSSTGSPRGRPTSRCWCASCAVDAPRGEHAFGEPVFSRRPTWYITSSVDRGDCLANPRRDVVERLVPGHPGPSVAGGRRSASAGRVCGRILNLIQRGRSLGAVPAARPGCRVALEFPDLEGVAIDVGEQTACRLTVEAGGRHQHVAVLDTCRPRARIEFDPVVPRSLGG